jgi:molybdopterin molybdotransferase
VEAVCAQGFSSAPGREQYVRAHLEVEDGRATVTRVGGHGSHLMGDLAAANALIVVPAGIVSVERGSTVQVLVLDREF